MAQLTNETKHLRMDQVKFMEDSLPQISLGPFLNTLSQINNVFQALTNQILRDVRSRIHVLHYLFVNVLPH